MGDKRGPLRPNWYLLSIAAMAVVYFLLSNKMLTSLKFREAFAARLGTLSRLLPVEFNWGLPVLALLLLYWAVVWLLERGRHRPPNRREKDMGSQGHLNEKAQPHPAHRPRESPVAK